MSPVKSKRAVREPGGVWLIALGINAEKLDSMIGTLHAQYPEESVTVLVAQNQQSHARRADEIWVFDRLGFIGFLAMIRRASWRHFQGVYHYVSDDGQKRAGWLKWCIWPRPKWYFMTFEQITRLDLRVR
ncbi:MAG: hypothetical protein ACON41_02630 [Parvibaculales bacterium]